MRRNGLRVLGFLIIYLTFFMLPASLYAGAGDNQGSGTGVEDERGNSEDSEPDDTRALPSDIQTRESFDTDTAESEGVGLTTYEAIRVLISLVVVVGLIWGLSVLLKRVLTVRGLASTTENLKVLYSLSLSPTRTLYLIRLSGRILLVGAGEGGLRTLCEITDPQEVSTILKELEFKGNYDMNPFKEKFSSLVNEAEKRDNREDLDSSRRRLEGAIDRLKNVNNDDGDL